MWSPERMRGSHPKSRVLRDELGFTLVEILIALLIGVFLLGALLTIVQANRTVFGNQNQLSQMQDSERMAMTMITDVIQSAGYFPQPWNYTLTTSLTAVAPFGIGQAIYGTYSGTPPGDVVYVRYMTMGGDGILNCSGQSNTGAANTTAVYVNQFQVVSGQLICNMNGTQYNLVNNVTNLSILYGVKANAAAAGNNVDTYMNAAQVNAAGLWGSVISALVQLTFTNPLYVASQPQDGVNQPTITLQRVVSVMNQTGPVE
jgi:type IV pilus assembly protein PilW